MPLPAGAVGQYLCGLVELLTVRDSHIRRADREVRRTSIIVGIA